MVLSLNLFRFCQLISEKSRRFICWSPPPPPKWVRILGIPAIVVFSPHTLYHCRDSYVSVCMCCGSILSLFKFSFLLSLGMVMYDNNMIMSLKQKKRKFEPRIKLSNIYIAKQTPSCGSFLWVCYINVMVAKLLY